MIFRGFGTGLAALGYLAVGSEAGLCRLSTTSLSASDAEATSYSVASFSTSSLTSTVFLDSETSTVLPDSSILETTSSTVSLSNDAVDTTTTALATTNDVSATVIMSTETMPSEIIDIAPTMTTDATSDPTPLATDLATLTTDAITSVATSELASATTSPAAAPTLLVNLGFDDLDLGTQPWDLGGSTSSNDETFRHDGAASLKITIGSGDRGQWRVITQNMNTAALEADVAYTYSFRFYSQAPGPVGTCQRVYLACYYGNSQALTSVGYKQIPLNQDYNTWYLASTTCTLSQAQIDAGNARIAVGYYVGSSGGTACYLDTVQFQKSQGGQ